MKYLYYEVNVDSNDVIEVELSGQANVRLMDSSNYNSFRANRAHRCYGGLATASPIVLRPPQLRPLVRCGGHGRVLGQRSSICVGEARRVARRSSEPIRRSDGLARAIPED